ncbi:MAG: hypothetical protein JW889_03385 [Verrucomicrobia bacterium]|nr:hypothetical protein [Verrucomicrobiota bacterium]
MAKAKNPTTLSGHLRIDSAKLSELGVLDVTLGVDIPLFIDPLLLPRSAHAEMSQLGARQYRHHFEQVIEFLARTQQSDDVAWRTARRLLEFHEIRGTCLGYGAASIQGSGFGTELTNRILRVGKQIVDLGIRDPDLFPAMALFEADIGPDRISDMTTNVIARALVAFNDRILGELGVEGKPFGIKGSKARFLENSLQTRPTPVILVPADILRRLPIARDWDDVASAAEQNQLLRNRVNEHIGELWAQKTKRDKARLRGQALASQEAFQTLLDALHEVAPSPYDVDRDAEGLVRWATSARAFASRFPLDLQTHKTPARLDDVRSLVHKIVDRFGHLVEHNGLNKELYRDGGRPKHESTAQRLFFAIAFCYCEANNVDISPELDTGSGKVDFKLSSGSDSRVLVEIKLSASQRLIHGYETQLEIYKEAQETMGAFYVVVDVGKMGGKLKRLQELRNERLRRAEPASELVVIDGILKPPASKRRESNTRT